MEGAAQVDVDLKIHLDRAEDADGPKLVWWAESDAVPGFSAAADHLPDLLAQAEAALAEILEGEFVLRPVLVAPQESEGIDVDRVPGGGEEPAPEGVRVRRTGPQFVAA